MDVELNYQSSEPPDEHMQQLLESFETLMKHFGDDEEAAEIIERETDLANEWIDENMPEEPETEHRTLGQVEANSKSHSSRSIFDDIDT